MRIVSHLLRLGSVGAKLRSSSSAMRRSAVVGFDNVGPSARVIYNLTTVAQPLSIMLRRGLELLGSVSS
jgi:DNA-binding LacI/PurR family transcriptional regulator